MNKIYIALLIIFILVSPAIGANTSTKDQTTYRIFVNDYRGFGHIYDLITNKPVIIQNNTLNIQVGDNIEFRNSFDSRITILNKQNLWDNKTGFLSGEYKTFNYTFEKVGTYNIYIKERPNLKLTIVVGSIEQKTIIKTTTPISTPTIIKTNTHTLKLNPSNLTSNITNNTTNATVNPLGLMFYGIVSQINTILLIIILIMIFVLSGRIQG